MLYSDKSMTKEVQYVYSMLVCLLA